ncbi:Hypothetical protein [Arabidopsis thaliana]|uniref:F11M15.17 protein n=1 Tax=Arabidopsis thaliana TaxID=3702 RepID=Q9SYD3_ARATH|nr:Hypothetical protein [Arabidopsis thaliana]
MSYVTKAYEIVVDHITIVSFAIAHGSKPESDTVFQYRLVKFVVRVMGDVLTQLKEHEEHITQILRIDELGFRNTKQYVLNFNDSKKPDSHISTALIEILKVCYSCILFSEAMVLYNIYNI